MSSSCSARTARTAPSGPPSSLAHTLFWATITTAQSLHGDARLQVAGGQEEEEEEEEVRVMVLAVAQVVGGLVAG